MLALLAFALLVGSAAAFAAWNLRRTPGRTRLEPGREPRLERGRCETDPAHPARRLRI